MIAGRRSIVGRPSTRRPPVRLTIVAWNDAIIPGLGTKPTVVNMTGNCTEDGEIEKQSFLGVSFGRFGDFAPVLFRRFEWSPLYI